MFVNPFLFNLKGESKSIIISLLGGGIQLIPIRISQLLFSQPDKLPLHYIKYLKESEILFDNPESFYSIFNELKNKSFEQTQKSPLNVIFTLTYSCNFKCDYCFQLRQEHHTGNKVINFDLIKNAKYIVSQLESIGNYAKGKSNIYLYGGEPLRKSPMLLKTVEKLLETFSFTNKIFITTNGYELNHYKSILEKYSNLNIQITIDGPRRFQDKRRKAKDNGSSFDKITSNLQLIGNLNHNIMIRLNVDEENYLFISELIEELNRLNIFSENEIYEHLYFAPVVNREREDIDINFYKNFIDYYFKYLYKYKIKVSNLRALNYAIRIVEGETISPSKFYCDAIYGKYIIDPDGQIGICEEAVLNKNQIVGQIDINGDVIIKNNPWNNRSVEEMIDCVNCEFKYMCSGGCPWKALNCTKNHKNAICDGFKEIFEYSIIKLLDKKLQYKISKKMPSLPGN